MQPRSNHLSQIGFLGDVACNNGILERLRRRDKSCVDPDLQAMSSRCDFVVANLEACWDRSGQSAPCGAEDKIHVRTEPLISEILNSINVKVVSSANNHAFDYGVDGWSSLKRCLQDSGVDYVGGGECCAESSKPLVVRKLGLNIGILAYASRDCGGIYSDETQGGANPFDIESAVTDIGNLKSDCDAIVLLIHWGEERLWMPSPLQRAQARLLAEAGADVIIGHHPHVLQGYEKVEDCHVFYSLGNVLFGDIENPKVAFRGPCSWSAFPIITFRKNAPAEIERIVGLRSLQAGLRLASPQGFSQRWRRLCAMIERPNYEVRYNKHINFMWRYYIPIRHTLLSNPVDTVRNLNYNKILRCIGLGRAPYA